MSDYVYVRVPRSTLDASDQTDDIIKTTRGLLFEMSFGMVGGAIIAKVAYNASAEGARVIEEDYLDGLESGERGGLV